MNANVTNSVAGHDILMVSEESGLLVVGTKRGHSLFTTSHECKVNWFTSVKTVKFLDASTNSHVFTLIETCKQLKGEKVAELRTPDGQLIGSVVMWKRFFRSCYELRNGSGDKISGFHCDGEKYVFDQKMGYVKHKMPSKTVAFIVKFGPDVGDSVKLLMIGSACLAITLAREAQETFLTQLNTPH